MEPNDLRILCTALGFAVVVTRNEKLSNREMALRAVAFAGLIEDFCRETLPDLFGESLMKLESADLEEKMSLRGRIADAVIAILKEKGSCVPDDLAGCGFKQEEIQRHWAMAYFIAKSELDMKPS